MSARFEVHYSGVGDHNREIVVMEAADTPEQAMGMVRGWFEEAEKQGADPAAAEVAAVTAGEMLGAVMLDLLELAGVDVDQGDAPQSAADAAASLIDAIVADIEREADDGLPADLDDNLVCTRAAGCPTCGNRRKDALVWREDDTLRCERCQTVYTPTATAKA